MAEDFCPSTNEAESKGGGGGRRVPWVHLTSSLLLSATNFAPLGLWNGRGEAPHPQPPSALSIKGNRLGRYICIMCVYVYVHYLYMYTYKAAQEHRENELRSKRTVRE